MAPFITHCTFANPHFGDGAMQIRRSQVGVIGIGLVVLAAIAWLTSSARTIPSQGSIRGTVQGPAGPEAGVWVIGETSDLGTDFVKIVVTDDAGRFVLPELPGARYQVWVRGYGLKDSDKVPARVGDDLLLQAEAAASPQEAAHVYPASYWYSLIEVPPAHEFPGTGPEGNGISPSMRIQEQWIDQMKQGCQLCHQLGNQVTREVGHLGPFDSTISAWDHRVTVGQRGTRMSGALSGMGRTRALEMFADWTDRIAAGEVPPQPPRPAGVERNVVLTLWDWGNETSYVHDEITTDKRNPTVNANGPVYAVSMSDDMLLILDPNTFETREIRVPVRDPNTPSYFPITTGFPPSPFWGDEIRMNAPANVHNPMMDHLGRIWMTSSIRPPGDNREWCREGSGNPFAEYYPLRTSGRQASYYDPGTDSFTLVDTCFGTHHLQFAEDDDHTLYFSGDGNVVGWVNTRILDETGDDRLAQGWCPTVVDTNGDGVITRPWSENRNRIDGSLDTRFTGFAYGIIPSPVDGAIWVARAPGYPGSIVRLEIGDDPPATCRAEVYQPPVETPEVPRSEWGFGPRGIDITRDGVVWTALSGSSHLASFDRRKCAVTSGPTATGQHCPEGWTLYPAPGPGLRNVEMGGSADFHYYNWVDQFNTLGLGADIPIMNGSTSDSLLALDPATGEWVVLRVPYPMGFYSRGLDGRIDDPDAGWKGRAVWADFGTNTPWHMEGGKGTLSKMVKFQIRPDPLAE
jgi:hypothetical protein